MPNGDVAIDLQLPTGRQQPLQRYGQSHHSRLSVKVTDT